VKTFPQDKPGNSCRNALALICSEASTELVSNRGSGGAFQPLPSLRSGQPLWPRVSKVPYAYGLRSLCLLTTHPFSRQLCSGAVALRVCSALMLRGCACCCCFAVSSGSSVVSLDLGVSFFAVCFLWRGLCTPGGGVCRFLFPRQVIPYPLDNVCQGLLPKGEYHHYWQVFSLLKRFFLPSVRSAQCPAARLTKFLHSTEV
jgi:hypothetical protein